jgi:hypothetical protein
MAVLRLWCAVEEASAPLSRKMANKNKQNNGSDSARQPRPQPKRADHNPHFAAALAGPAIVIEALPNRL